MFNIDIRIKNDIIRKLELEHQKSLKSPKPKKIIKDPSSKNMEHNISRDNFMKFQWPWIL